MKGEFEMKKILMAIFMALMMLSVGVTAFAASGSFTSSPSANRAPTVVEFENASEDCTATIVIYAYADRDSLDAAAKAKLESAYASVAAAKDLGALGTPFVAQQEALSLHPPSDLGGLAARRGAQVAHPVTGLRIQQLHRCHGAGFL